MYNIVERPTIFQQKIKPISLQVDFANIPELLKRLNLWVVWAYVWKDGRWTKLPFQPVRALSFATRKGTTSGDQWVPVERLRCDGTDWADSSGCGD